MHSWRVLILPFVDEPTLYREYDFSQPWDSPANRSVLERIPAVYRCPSHRAAPTTTTHYCAVTGPGTMFSGADAARWNGVPDGLAHVVMVGETAGVIPWTSPEDIDVSRHATLGDRSGFSSPHPGERRSAAAHFLFGDGSVKTLDAETVTPERLRKLAGIDDGTPEGW